MALKAFLVHNILTLVMTGFGKRSKTKVLWSFYEMGHVQVFHSPPPTHYRNVRLKQYIAHYDVASAEISRPHPQPAPPTWLWNNLPNYHTTSSHDKSNLNADIAQSSEAPCGADCATSQCRHRHWGSDGLRPARQQADLVRIWTLCKSL